MSGVGATVFCNRGAMPRSAPTSSGDSGTETSTASNADDMLNQASLEKILNRADDVLQRETPSGKPTTLLEILQKEKVNAESDTPVDETLATNEVEDRTGQTEDITPKTPTKDQTEDITPKTPTKDQLPGADAASDTVPSTVTTERDADSSPAEEGGEPSAVLSEVQMEKNLDKDVEEMQQLHPASFKTNEELRKNTVTEIESAPDVENVGNKIESFEEALKINVAELKPIVDSKEADIRELKDNDTLKLLETSELTAEQKRDFDGIALSASDGATAYKEEKFEMKELRSAYNEAWSKTKAGVRNSDQALVALISEEMALENIHTAKGTLTPEEVETLRNQIYDHAIASFIEMWSCSEETKCHLETTPSKQEDCKKDAEAMCKAASLEKERVFERESAPEVRAVEEDRGGAIVYPGEPHEEELATSGTPTSGQQAFFLERTPMPYLLLKAGTGPQRERGDLNLLQQAKTEPHASCKDFDIWAKYEVEVETGTGEAKKKETQCKDREDCSTAECVTNKTCKAENLFFMTRGRETPACTQVECKTGKEDGEFDPSLEVCRGGKASPVVELTNRKDAIEKLIANLKEGDNATNIETTLTALTDKNKELKDAEEALEKAKLAFDNMECDRTQKFDADNKKCIDKLEPDCKPEDGVEWKEGKCVLGNPATAQSQSGPTCTPAEKLDDNTKACVPKPKPECNGDKIEWDDAANKCKVTTGFLQTEARRPQQGDESLVFQEHKAAAAYDSKMALLDHLKEDLENKEKAVRDKKKEVATADAAYIVAVGGKSKAEQILRLRESAAKIQSAMQLADKQATLESSASGVAAAIRQAAETAVDHKEKIFQSAVMEEREELMEAAQKAFQAREAAKKAKAKTEGTGEGTDEASDATAATEETPQAQCEKDLTKKWDASADTPECKPKTEPECTGEKIAWTDGACKPKTAFLDSTVPTENLFHQKGAAVFLQLQETNGNCKVSEGKYAEDPTDPSSACKCIARGAVLDSASQKCQCTMTGVTGTDGLSEDKTRCNCGDGKAVNAAGDACIGQALVEKELKTQEDQAVLAQMRKQNTDMIATAEEATKLLSGYTNEMKSFAKTNTKEKDVQAKRSLPPKHLFMKKAEIDAKQAQDALSVQNDITGTVTQDNPEWYRTAKSLVGVSSSLGTAEVRKEEMNANMEAVMKNSVRASILASIEQLTLASRRRLLEEQFVEAVANAPYVAEVLARKKLVRSKVQNRLSFSPEVAEKRLNLLVESEKTALLPYYLAYLRSKRSQYEREAIRKPFYKALGTKNIGVIVNAGEPTEHMEADRSLDPAIERKVDPTTSTVKYAEKRAEVNQMIDVASQEMNSQTNAAPVVAAEVGEELIEFDDLGLSYPVSSFLQQNAEMVVEENNTPTKQMEMQAQKEEADAGDLPSAFLQLSSPSPAAFRFAARKVMPRYSDTHADERVSLEREVRNLDDEITALTIQLQDTTKEIQKAQTELVSNSQDPAMVKSQRRQLDEIQKKHDNLQTALEIAEKKRERIQNIYATQATRDNSVLAEISNLKGDMPKYLEAVEQEERLLLEIENLQTLVAMARRGDTSLFPSQALIQLELKRTELKEAQSSHKVLFEVMKRKLKRHNSFAFFEVAARQMTRHINQDFYDAQERCKKQNIRERLREYQGAVDRVRRKTEGASLVQRQQAGSSELGEAALHEKRVSSLVLSTKWERMKAKEDELEADQKRFVELRSKFTTDTIDLFDNTAMHSVSDHNKRQVLDNAKAYVTDQVAYDQIENAQSRLEQHQALRDPEYDDTAFDRAEEHRRQLKLVSEAARQHNVQFLKLRGELLKAVTSASERDVKKALEREMDKSVDFQLELIKEAIFGRSKVDGPTLIKLEALCKEDSRNQMIRVGKRVGGCRGALSGSTSLVYELEKEGVTPARDVDTLSKLGTMDDLQLRATVLRLREKQAEHILYQLATGDAANADDYMVEARRVRQLMDELRDIKKQKSDEDIKQLLAAQSVHTDGKLKNSNIFSLVHSVLDLTHQSLALPRTEKCVAKPLLESLYECEVGDPSCAAVNLTFQEIVEDESGETPPVTIEGSHIPGCCFLQTGEKLLMSKAEASKRKKMMDKQKTAMIEKRGASSFIQKQTGMALQGDNQGNVLVCAPEDLESPAGKKTEAQAEADGRAFCTHAGSRLSSRFGSLSRGAKAAALAVLGLEMAKVAPFPVQLSALQTAMSSRCTRFFPFHFFVSTFFNSFFASFFLSVSPQSAFTGNFVGERRASASSFLLLGEGELTGGLRGKEAELEGVVMNQRDLQKVDLGTKKGPGKLGPELSEVFCESKNLEECTRDLYSRLSEFIEESEVSLPPSPQPPSLYSYGGTGGEEDKEQDGEQTSSSSSSRKSTGGSSMLLKTTIPSVVSSHLPAAGISFSSSVPVVPVSL
uniref:Uncharacterized protein n=1 Tax=Chromera velia CCMP2878 TaxID=1169474 RepID=A0A0G4IA28_9ALVE|eukprot:Cvel_12320.t1-p1 / transcript=Cvel_12320.t1 / gene=Cvel_12320 / organism=Chromera_velia_CCMP2878 / gene_product=Centrosomal protein of 290 kDa, putative / transcript_product=Centrosomal protein of 290 kDa, putative / location=Cvel_scaffold801:2451-34091(-) / protein_length=2407 / sequence_SO=supercontig / SO=protein_coding / is_pseudo=false